MRRIALALVLLAAGTPARADEDVAKFLFGQAKRAFALRKYDEAVAKLLRVQEEDPSLLEATFVLGQVYEKMKQPGKALAAYRALRDACTAEGATLDKKAERLLKRAQQRIGVLGKGEKAFDQAQDAFGDALVAFARRVHEDDPDIALDALRRGLSVHPKHAGLRQWHGKFGGGTATDSESAGGGWTPIPGIQRWDDLLARRAIPAGKSTEYEEGVLTFDNKGGTVYWTGDNTSAPDVFVFEIEFRFTKEHAPGHLLGLVFGKNDEMTRETGAEWVMAFAQKSIVKIVHASGKQNIEIADAATKPFRSGTWHKLTIAIQGRKVRLFVNGKQTLNSSIPGRKSLDGAIGIFHQRCAAEVRSMRLGTK